MKLTISVLVAALCWGAAAFSLLTVTGCEDDTPYGKVIYVPVPVPSACDTPEPPECEETCLLPGESDEDSREETGSQACGAHARIIRKWYDKYAEECGWIGGAEQPTGCQPGGEVGVGCPD